MISFIRNIPRHIKEGFVGLWRHMLMSVSAMTTVAVTLIIISTFMVIIFNIRDFTVQVENDVQIHVKIEMEANQESIDTLQTQIKNIEGVKNVEYSDRENELQKFMDAFGEDGKLFEMYSGEENPFRNAFIVDVVDGNYIEQVSKKIETLENVEEANFGGNNILKMVEGFNSIRNGLFILVGGLCLLAILLISNTIKLTIAHREREIEIMRTVGATSSFVRTPFLIEGILIGIIGSIIPITLTYFGYQYLYNLLGGVFFSPIFTLRPLLPFAYEIGAILLIIGISVGFIGSYLSTSKYLRLYR